MGSADSESLRARPVGGTTTFGGRKGRMSPTRARALAEIVPRLAADVDAIKREHRPIIVEIGCGRGDVTAVMAETTDRDSLVVACEANAAIVASLAVVVDEGAIENVRLWVGDAFALLERLGPESVDEIRVWFPDPWPKPRHAPKRLVTAERMAVLAAALRPGGRFRLATDDAPYAAQTRAAIAAEPLLQGGEVPRPADRPETVFEARGRREGRLTTDFEAVRDPPP